MLIASVCFQSNPLRGAKAVLDVLQKYSEPLPEPLRSLSCLFIRFLLLYDLRLMHIEEIVTYML